MAYVRYKLPEPTHKLLKKVALRLGMKESEVSRIAMMEYLKSLGVIGDRIRKPSLSEKLAEMKPSKREALIRKIKRSGRQVKTKKEGEEIIFDIQ